MLAIKSNVNISDNETSIVIDKYLQYIVKKDEQHQTLFIDDENDYRKIV